MVVLLEQRDRVYLHDAGGRVPVLACGRFVMGTGGVEVSLELRHGGKVSFRGRLLNHWVVGSEACPVTIAEAPGDLVLSGVLRGGRVAVRSFVRPDAGVMLLLGVTPPADRRSMEPDNEMAEALGYAPVWDLTSP